MFPKISMILNLLFLIAGIACNDRSETSDSASDTAKDSTTDAVESWGIDSSGYLDLEGTRIGPNQPAAFADPASLRLITEDAGAFYWLQREGWWPMGFTALNAPVPHYEIHAIALYTIGFDNDWCANTQPINLLVYVGDEPPSSFVGSSEVLPEIPLTASIEAVGVVGSSSVGEDGASEILAGVFEEPLSIEEAGTLWLGYSQAGATINATSCPMGVNVTSDELSSADGGIKKRKSLYG